MFDEELMRHMIAYIKDYPEDVKLDDYREDTRVLVSGRMGLPSSWGRNDSSFVFAFNYGKDGKLKNVNGIDFKFDTTPLVVAFKEAMIKNFKLKKKATALGKKGKR